MQLQSSCLDLSPKIQAPKIIAIVHLVDMCNRPLPLFFSDDFPQGLDVEFGASRDGAFLMIFGSPPMSQGRDFERLHGSHFAGRSRSRWTCLQPGQWDPGRKIRNLGRRMMVRNG